MSERPDAVPARPLRRPPRPRQKLRRRTWRALLRDVAGHATTETVLIIPVFIAIWGGVWYTQQRYRRAINMAQYTRAHVWAHAYEGGCEGPTGSTSMRETERSDAGFVSGAVDLLFGSGLIPGMRFSEVEGRRDGQIERPAVLGEGTAQMTTNLVLLCNERTQDEQTFWEVAWAMFFG